MKILITGATGYVGHQLALALAEQNYEIHALVRNPNSTNIPSHKNIKVFKGDINDMESITTAIKGCNQVYHTAALVKPFDKDQSLFHKINVEGTHNLLQKALQFGIEKFLFTSSCSVIGPSSGKVLNENDLRETPFEFEYDITKHQAEILVKEYAQSGLCTVIVSPSKIYGYSNNIETKDISVNKMIDRFVKGRLTFMPSPGKLLSNYCFINDVVEGHILAMQNGKSGEKYILGGENISYEDFFKFIRNISGTKAKLIATPKIVVKILGVLQWIQYLAFGKEPYVTAKGIKQIFCNKIFSSDKAIKHLGYKITPLVEGLRLTIKQQQSQKIT